MKKQQRKKLTPAAAQLRWASGVLRAHKGHRDKDGRAWPERSNSDFRQIGRVTGLDEAGNREETATGFFELALGMTHKLFGGHKKGSEMDKVVSDALTTLAVAHRVSPPEAQELFLWLYGDRNNERLVALSSTLYHRIIFPTEAGVVDPRVGVNICTSMLLRHFWFRNGRDYDRRRTPLSPTEMAILLGMIPTDEFGRPESEQAHNRGRKAFDRFQRQHVFMLLELWETQAENQIKAELIDKGFLGG